ncbi:MAG: zinc ribbon domain-containing protein [Candidatus Rokubacteria bacterium]|nr:zinc ribbon domain-containing protein [Candidatus Rokubacteria bacterium]
MTRADRTSALDASSAGAETSSDKPPRETSARCGSCRHLNRESARFCEWCGGRLGRRCPACGATGRAASEVCDACGAALGEDT